MKILLESGLFSLLATAVFGLIALPILKRLHAGQPVLGYVKEHEKKNGTPTMGGLFFIPAAALTFFLFGGGKSRTAVVALSIGAAFMFVGFLDDFIKIKYRKNEGLKAYQKIIFQTAIAIVAGAFAYKNGLTRAYIPFYKGTAELGVFSAPLAAFIFVAITNSVNLTDGLDSLAGGTCFAYLSFTVLLISAESAFGDIFAGKTEEEGLKLLAACLAGAIAGYLIFNVPPAKVFMGDAGSLSLGGFIGAISIFSGNSLFVPLLGAAFVASSVSVIIQVIHYKRTKRRVFLMAPLHHHFQKKGFSESRISYCYFIVTCIIGAVSVIFYL